MFASPTTRATALVLAVAGCKSPNPHYVAAHDNFFCDSGEDNPLSENYYPRDCPQDSGEAEAEAESEAEGFCGDTICGLTEGCLGCDVDCGACADNGICDAEAAETCFSDPADCGSCCGNLMCDLIAPAGRTPETEKGCPTDCNGVPGDGVCSDPAPEDDFASIEFCYESPTDCFEHCTGADECSEVFDCARRQQGDLEGTVQCMDDGSTAAQGQFAALHACWVLNCSAECQGEAFGCTDCSCLRCAAEAGACGLGCG